MLVEALLVLEVLEVLEEEVLEEEEVGGGGCAARRRRWRCRRRWARQGFRLLCRISGRCRAASTVSSASTFSAPHRASNSPTCGGRGKVGEGSRGVGCDYTATHPLP